MLNQVSYLFDDNNKLVQCSVKVSGHTTLPLGTRAIGQAFVGCSGISSLELPIGVQHIGHHAFAGCNNIKAIWLPKSIVSVNKTAFCWVARHPIHVYMYACSMSIKSVNILLPAGRIHIINDISIPQCIANTHQVLHNVYQAAYRLESFLLVLFDTLISMLGNSLHCAMPLELATMIIRKNYARVLTINTDQYGYVANQVSMFITNYNDSVRVKENIDFMLKFESHPKYNVARSLFRVFKKG